MSELQVPEKTTQRFSCYATDMIKKVVNDGCASVGY